MRGARPADLGALRTLLTCDDGKGRLVAGGTDLVIHLHRHPEEDPYLIDISSLEELRQIEEVGDALSIGAAVTFSAIEDSPLIRERACALAMAAAVMGSTQIRNRATLGGNVANASAAADGTSALCALDALAVVEDSRGNQERIAVRSLITAPGKTVIGPGRFLRSFLIPPQEGPSAFFKTGSRRTVAISKLNIALGRRLILGALAPAPLDVPEAKALLRGRSEETFLDGLTAAVERAIPTRTSLAYKRCAVRGLGDDLWNFLSEAGR